METNQCLDNMARKENEKVGIFNCHGMGGNQVTQEERKWFSNMLISERCFLKWSMSDRKC